MIGFRRFQNMLIAVLLVPLSAYSQQRFPKVVPAGNYSGICALGSQRYAVVSDKAETDGFHVFRIDIDTIRGRILNVENEGYRSSGLPNCDMEAICFFPPSGTVFIASERDSEVNEYSLDGRRTGRRLEMPEYVRQANRNYGLESLCYDVERHRFYTTLERPLKGDSTLLVLSFNDQLQLAETYTYVPDAPISRKYYQGVSELCALSDGRLLVLERQIRVPRLKLGAKTVIRLYEVFPGSNALLEKRLVCEFKTRLTLTGRKFANYEGVCRISSDWLLMVADSQNQYKGILRDWFLLTPLDRNMSTFNSF